MSIVHLEAGCVVCEPLDPVQSDLDLLLADGVVTSGIVVTGVLLKVHTTFMNWLLMLALLCFVFHQTYLARDHLTRMEQIPVGSCPNLQEEWAHSEFC